MLGLARDPFACALSEWVARDRGWYREIGWADDDVFAATAGGQGCSPPQPARSWSRTGGSTTLIAVEAPRKVKPD